MIKRTVTGLIISAGYSSRMKLFKPLIEIEEKSFLQHIVEKLVLVADEIVIVAGYNHEEIEEHIAQYPSLLRNNIKFVFNPDYKLGMFTSLQAGLKHVSNPWVLYHFVDQPLIPENFYKEFVNQIDSNFNWIQPSYKGQAGHPIIFSETMIKEIISSPVNSNLKLISSRETAKRYWDCNFNAILHDIDTDSDLSNLLKL